MAKEKSSAKAPAAVDESKVAAPAAVDEPEVGEPVAEQVSRTRELHGNADY